MQVEVILASATNTGSPPIYSIRMRYPRPIHGEIMTHRVFGRNARSSRAVPVQTMLNEVRTIPYVPWHWGKNQKGMQASEECNQALIFKDFENQDLILSREEAWLAARDAAVMYAEAFMTAGYHKQNPNRLLEPFSWIDTLITATQWQNFLWLRQHHAAEPHLQDLANLVAEAMQYCTVQHLEHGEWHLPYISEEEKRLYHTDVLKKLSAARCARISYKPFNGEASIEAELDRYNLLVTDERVHASPLEHQATPDDWIPTIPISGKWEAPDLHGNLTQWIQHRKLIPNEVYHG
ncbi:N4 gp30-like protein [Sulfitobacter phage EE36phi1]|uniref:N4 gp30-like protein n=1 Tax=Sulfitobacter phage EE36phi1 TaxID=490913 RepID=C4NTB0_9CAUD|nr:putative thymidylate synthase [Sulfitobacter phage EE36phi1]ACL81376.1 N4 gp30-like protein [Sulfitobacter phage EE36phi1]